MEAGPRFLLRGEITRAICRLRDLAPRPTIYTTTLPSQAVEKAFLMLELLEI